MPPIDSILLRRLLKIVAMPLLFLLVTGAVARAQSALDGFDPNANGTIRAVVVQPDGKILIGGDFTTVAPNGGATVTRNRIARLNPDGTLDMGFDPSATGTNAAVQSIALQADGKILAGGSFTSIGGQLRNNIARLDATTGLADSFDPNANSTVFAIAVQTDGKILVGGFFGNIGGQPRNRLARLDPATGLADSFDAALSGLEIFAITIQPDGKILAGGFFMSIGGQPRNNLARLDPITALADSFNPNAADEVHAIAVQADGKVLAGGFFINIGGQPRNSIARLDAVTGAADSFNPNANNGVFAIAVQADGKILAGGDFFGIGGQQRHRIARLDPTTGLADSFDPSPNNNVLAIAVQPDGKILAGGMFTTLTPNGGTAVTRGNIARLETDGRVDRTLNLNVVGEYVQGIAVQPDGKVLIGGLFSSVLSVARNNIARLNSDGTLDTAFNPNANNVVQSIVVQADGKIMVGGAFNGANSIGGATRNRIARLDATTGLADSFNPDASGGGVQSIAVQGDGKILVSGFFTNIGGQPRSCIARLDGMTGLADSFNPNASGGVIITAVRSIAVQRDGKILAAGEFSSIGGQTRNNIARLDAATGLADSFNPNANNPVFSIVLQADGKILAGGEFASIGGQPRNRIARLDPATGLADSFNPDAQGAVWSVALQGDGKILVGGEFQAIGGELRSRIARLDAATGLPDSFDPNSNRVVTSIVVEPDGKILAGGNFESFIGGQSRSYFARLSNDTAAQQDLAVTQTAVTWTRGGSSPQLARVTFESSTDSVNYMLLGNGTGMGSNWTLTGLNLPPGQNIYIRARGYYRTGVFNGSESITESVRTVFLPGPIATPTPSGTPQTPTPTPTPVETATPSPTPPLVTPSPTPTATPLPSSTPTVSPTPTPTATATPTATPGTLGNISTRLRVLSGDNVLIGGLIATGTGSPRVILRAIGPSLSGLGVPGALEDTTLDLFQGGTLLMSNDDWQNSSQQAEIAASGFAPGNAAESAIIWTLTPGQGYTAIVRGKNGATGVGVVEAYDLDHLPTAKLGNISTRGFVDVDDNVMIAGVIVGPGSGTSAKILARALGPTLSDFGVPGALADPTLDLVNSSGTVVRSNNNWQDDSQQRALIEAAGLGPGHFEEAALVETVTPGAYTAIVRGLNRTTGVGLVEVYHVP